MIEIMFVAPCTYDPSKLGCDEAEIGYFGEADVVKTAREYIGRISWRARLLLVIKNGQVLLDRR
jgi:hypothetical protein